MLAQTTDSGSNKNTMAMSMYALLRDKTKNVDSEEGLRWDPSTMHIRCICHKLALIVNAGLWALELKTLPPRKNKESVLGFFPVLGRLEEEEEPEESQPVQGPGVSLVLTTNIVPPNEDDSGSNYGNADDKGS
jgi:hypothetical protein